jgi:hypothetical protein
MVARGRRGGRTLAQSLNLGNGWKYLTFSNGAGARRCKGAAKALIDKGPTPSYLSAEFRT